MIGLRALRVQPNRLVQVIESAGVVAMRPLEVAAPEIGGRVVRIDGDRLIEVLQRQIVLLGLAIGKRPVGVSARKMRIKFNRVAEVLDRARIFAKFERRQRRECCRPRRHWDCAGSRR